MSSGREGWTWSFSVSEGIGDSPVKQKQANGQKTFLIKQREKMVSGNYKSVKDS